MSLLSHPVFLATYLFVISFPSTSNYPNLLVLPKMVLTMWLYKNLVQWPANTALLVSCRHYWSMGQELQKLTLSWGNRMLESGEERQELFKSDVKNEEKQHLLLGVVDRWVFLTLRHHSPVLIFSVCTFKLSPINPASLLHMCAGSETQLEGAWCWALWY